MDKNICIIGLGYVGLTLSIVLAKKNFNVIGIENNKEILKNLKKSKSQIYEPNLNKFLEDVISKNKLTIKSSLPKKNKCTTFIITVGTPVYNKKINLKNLLNVVSEISSKMNEGSLLILRSTVKIGTTDLVKDILSKNKKKLDIAFCPERTMEGRALEELKALPQIIGGYTKKSSLRAKNIFRKVTKKCFIVSDPKTAEMIKLVDNSQRDLFFSYSNEVAMSCDYLKINVNEVIKIGKKNYPRTNLYLPGPVGGPCLEKDPYIFVESLKKENFYPKLTYYSRKNNEKLISHSVKIISNFFKKINKKITKICIFGLTFKGNPETADLRGSTVFPLIDQLKIKFNNSNIYGYDPMLNEKDIRKLKIKYSKNLKLSFNKSDLIIFHNNNPNFSNFNLNYYVDFMNSNSLIYDFWSQLKLSTINKKNVKYLSLGNLNNILIDDEK